MDIPLELRRSPPAVTLEWVAGHVGAGARVTGVRRLPNAWAAAVHAIVADDNRGRRHDLVLRRWTRTDLPPDDGVVENEAAALRVVGAAAGIHTPELVAFDATGAATDVPALLMTRLPGRDELSPQDLDAYLDGLVDALRGIHAIPVADSALGEYRPWGVDTLDEPPSWSRRPDVWLRAFNIARRPIPAHRQVLCHRDFHPGNVLWRHGRVTGVVDWTHACRGPAAADVAHCRANLAVLFGIDVADDFARRYGPVDDLAWFDVADLAGWGDLNTWRWHDAGRTDITDDSIVDAFDAFLAQAVERVD